MTTRTRAAGLLTAITMTALLAACSATGDSANNADSATSEGAAEVVQPPSSAAGGADSGGAADAPTGSSPARLGDQAATGQADVAKTEDGTTSPDLQRAVISSGTVSLVSKDVAETRRDVQRVVDAQGGEVTEETTETDDDGDTSYSRFVVRVPSGRFGDAMTALEGAGELRSATRGSEDVTTQVIDTGVRVRAQEASLKRVELLLRDAEDLKDIIWIESQLTDRQAELDSLKSQRSWLADQTSLSTITVDIATAPTVVEDEPEDVDEPAGFLAGLRGGTDALLSVLSAVTTIVGALLPFAALGLVVGLPVWLVVRRRRQTDAPAA